MSTSELVLAQSSTLRAPDIEYGQLAPMLIVFGVAVAGVLVEAFLPRRGRYSSHLVLALGGLTAAFVAVVMLAGTRDSAVGGAVAVDGPTLFLQGTILLISIPAILLIAERSVDSGVAAATAEVTAASAAEPEGGTDAFTPQAFAVPGSVAEREATKNAPGHTEVFPLTLFAVGGMLLFPASNDLLTMFVALEVLSLPLYLLCGLARRRRLLSQEAALKYFLLGAFSSAFFLFGVALLYGYAGTVELPRIADALARGTDDKTLALIGTALLSVGLLFKIGAVPFHSWIPDVYQGAPTPITAFMAAATKVAAVGAMLRIFYVALPDLRSDWRPVMWGVAILTMVVGAVMAVTQNDVKRMLAYSSVAHAGFILTGLVAANRAGLSSTMFYLLAYGFSTLGAFAVVTLVRDSRGEATDLSRWAGLGRRSPLVGGVFALFLLAFAGIPLTSGFVSKFAVFQAAIEGGAVPLVLVGVVSSAIAAFFYVRVIVLMFFSEPQSDAPTIVVPSMFTAAAIAVGVVVTVVLGILPQGALDLADQAAVFFR
ncbi:NADH-quinone oxidoreductase subunit NuoN [Rhodococcus opacus]|uniref:NADH-quinone oxidoreductase subunit N n=1 Tax=Rhodococcus opacus TaxID=37919 RepID=A0AAX3YKF6_RHOOP|nr:NADH-quinone oxidoreductase subunit NuoN [Rhodococcus opacus]ELB91126.1 NADH:ubiquinone oxidoreductase subunit N [Rhodococcus wratislaviensis IFP 2016]MBA8959792.1 NADH-quinone oxidoreductase subunit N [Rhodococcus opacus]MBP2205357.1 NADH-quinone oxidoreductase subunit N [Rhodococcus opacus]MCZ4582379.1 NADH-quinone oxidoreductase subunit NuoN [Rhodococcus opacus]MDJ0414788.1 NADH-quinone oxidoreductase subunit NuoN [Rhodococcus opacus]